MPRGPKATLAPAPPASGKPQLRQFNSARQLSVSPELSHDGSVFTPSPPATTPQTSDQRLVRRHSHAVMAMSVGQSACGGWVAVPSGAAHAPPAPPAAGSERSSANGSERFSHDTPQHMGALGRTRSLRTVDSMGRHMRASDGYDNSVSMGPPPAASSGQRCRAPEVFLPTRSATSFTAGNQRPSLGATSVPIGPRPALKNRPSDGAINVHWQDTGSAQAPEPRRVSFAEARRPSGSMLLFTEGLRPHIEEQPAAGCAKPARFSISAYGSMGSVGSDGPLRERVLPAIQKEKPATSLLARFFK